MKIALIGYGKMGKAIEAIAIERGHEIVLKVGIENLEDFTEANLKKADVAIEFTGPESAFENIKKIMDAGVSVVSGSTGWLNRYDDAVAYNKEKGTGFLYASNFSLGVNLFFALNTFLAKMMAPHKQYNASITEIHHTAKLDAPSGTAITLAEQLIEQLPGLHQWIQEENHAPDSIYIESKRIDPAPGTHTIRYVSKIDTITIEHEAHSRKGFALGAVLAAEFLNNRKGEYSMKDVLQIGY
ncbi:MAG: 4-hydroxy-tetrahydrodipicolinate reductase [Chitinophagaceae bacterium]|nr:4-hydroxy-tetrahydrodipicolinate reductase [Chitinophagaceae bacterium]